MGCPFWETQFFIGGYWPVSLNIGFHWYLMCQKMIRHSVKIIKTDFNEFEFIELNPKTILWFDKRLNFKSTPKIDWILKKTDRGGPWFSRDCIHPAGSCTFSQDRGLCHFYLLSTTMAVEWPKRFYQTFSLVGFSHTLGLRYIITVRYYFSNLIFSNFISNFSSFPITLSNFN